MKYSLAKVNDENERDIIREKYNIASFRFHYNETRRKKYFKNIAYRSKRKKEKKRKKRKSDIRKENRTLL